MRIAPLLLTALLLLPAAARAQAPADSAAIRQTALDYIEGWYTGDGERMERALHPELAKRIVSTGANGRSWLDQQGAMALVQSTRAGRGRQVPEARREKEVRILDIFQNAASVRVTAADWIDYMQMARSNGRWVIVNVLWEMKPKGNP